MDDQVNLGVGNSCSFSITSSGDTQHFRYRAEETLSTTKQPNTDWWATFVCIFFVDKKTRRWDAATSRFIQMQWLLVVNSQTNNPRIDAVHVPWSLSISI
jgi:hypothetical protein